MNYSKEKAVPDATVNGVKNAGASIATTQKETRKCPNCSRRVSGHPNKKFCNSRCKDRYHNRTNPRGYGARDDWDRYMQTVHPFSAEAF